MRPELETAVAELKSGSPGGLERALAMLQQTVFSFSMKVCGHREDAEDTAQETLFRTAPQLAKFESSKALAVWLYKVARSRCLMSRRRSKFAPREHISLDDVLPDRHELESLATSGDGRPDQQLLRKESAAELRHAILKIPPDYRQVLVLHDMEELSTQEVAQITGLREGTVRVRLHRARAFLRNELAGRPHGRRRGARNSLRPQACKKLFAALSDYIDQEIDPATCDRLEAHLGGCAPCKAYLDSLEEIVRRCRTHCTEQMKAKIAGELQQLVAQAFAASNDHVTG
jgi:RNA polymerase sigma-70 factor, ECF subfamily